MRVLVKDLARIVGLLFVAVVLVGGIVFLVMPSVYAAPGDEDSAENYLFYEIASENAAMVEETPVCEVSLSDERHKDFIERFKERLGISTVTTVDDKGNETTEEVGSLPCGDLGAVGAYVAFIDDSLHPVESRSIFIPNSNNSQDINYAGRGFSVKEGDAKFAGMLRSYLAFGSVLSGLGLDEVSKTGGLDGADVERKGLGFAVYALYTVADGVDSLFMSVLDFLADYDPLRFVFGQGINTEDAWQDVDGPRGGQTMKILGR